MSEGLNISSDSPSARAPGPWLILPLVTAVAILAATKLGYHSSLLSAFTLKWFFVALLVGCGAFLSTVFEASVGLMIGGAAIAVAIYVDEILTTLQFHGSTGELVKYEAWHLVLCALCLGTAVLGLQGTLARNPITKSFIATGLSAAGALTVLGMLVPPSFMSFSDWNRLGSPGIGTFSLLMFLAVMGFLLIALPLQRSQLSRWVVTGVGASLLVDLVISQAKPSSGISFVFFGRPGPVVAVGVLGVVGLSIASLLTSTEIDETVRTPARTAAVGDGISVFGSVPDRGTKGQVGSVGQASVYGSIGARFGALLIDGFISLAFFVPGYALTFASLSARRAGSQQALALLGLGLILAGPIVNLILYCTNVGRRGQSWGHRACGVRVVDAVTGGPIGAGRAFGRVLMRAISAMPCYLGLFWALWDPQRRGWHDMVARTVVVPAGNGTAAVGIPAAGPGFVPPPPSAPALAPNSIAVASPPAPIGYIQPMAVPAQIPFVPLPSASPTPSLIEAPFISQPIDQTISYRPKVASTPVFKIVFDSGDEAPFDRSMLIGRDPATAGPADEGFALVRIVDPTMSVSKTHLALGLSDGAVWVEDRRSTNGVSVAAPNSGPADVAVGQRTPVELGSTVHFGSRWLRVERR
jgi:uncharacterized RDD family membrane protein YckC